MKRRIIPIVGLLVLSVFACANLANKSTVAARDTELIVELKDGQNGTVEEREKIQKEFLNELQSVVGLNYRVRNTYKYATNALKIDVSSSSVDSIKNFSTVKKTAENKFYIFNDLLSESYAKTDDGVLFNASDDSDTIPSTNYSKTQMNVPSTSNGGEGTIVAILDSSFSLNHNAFSSSISNPRYSKADMATKTSESGFHGKPDSTHSTYYNDKIPYYYDYAGDTGSDNFDLHPDYDVFTKYSYHGNHVASIAAGNGSYKGIAPNAQIAMMKVFITYADKDNNAVTGATDEAILNALEDCVILGVDGINLSLGSDLDDFTSNSVTFSVIKELQESGTSVNVAAGNNGKSSYKDSGPYAYSVSSNVETGVIGSYSNSDGMVIASGNLSEDESLDSSMFVGDSSVYYSDQVVDHTGKEADGTETETKFTEQMPFSSLIPTGKDETELEYVVVPNYGEEKDYSDIDVNGKVAIVARGTTTFVDKVNQASKHGASAVIIYNTADGASFGWMILDDVAESDLIPVASVSHSAINSFTGKADSKITIKKSYVSDFSSDGARYDLGLKPDIMTPGQNIYGAINVDNGSESLTKYAYLSGTSMATPNYTGAEALILGENTYDTETERSEYAKSIQMRTMSTANPVEQANGTYYSPRKQGSGYIDISDAIDTKVYLEGSENKAKVELKNNSDIAAGNIKFDVKVHNEDQKARTYKATLVVQAPEVKAIDSSDFTDIGATTVLTPYDITLDTFTFDINIDASSESTISVDQKISDASKEYLNSNFENGTYLEGYLFLDSTSDVDLSIPYLGFYGDYNSERAVEEFDFEKSADKVYGSDLLNSTLHTAGLESADYGSTIAVSGSSFSQDAYAKVVYNQASFLDYGEAATYNENTKTIFLGISGNSTSAVIQQYVNRSVVDNKITMTSKDSGQVAFTDAMFSFVYSDSKETEHNLHKSMLDSALYDSKIYADRAYTVLNFTDSSGSLLYPEGDYELKMEYTLAAGYTQTYTYNVKLLSSTSSLQSNLTSSTLVSDSGSDVMHIAFGGSTPTNVSVNGTKVEFNTSESGFYVDLPYDDYSSTDSLILRITNSYGITSVICLNKESIKNNAYSITSSELLNGMKVDLATEKVSDSSGFDAYKYTYSVTNAKGKVVTFKRELICQFMVPSEYLENKENIHIYGMDAAGNISSDEANFTISDDGMVSVRSGNGIFKVVFGNSANAGSNVNTPVVVVSIIVGVLVIAILGVVVFKTLKKKKGN